MYFHNYLSDSFGQKISTYSQLEEGVVILQSRPILMTSCYFAIIEYTVELTISDYYKLVSICGNKTYHKKRLEIPSMFKTSKFLFRNLYARICPREIEYSDFINHISGTSTN